MKKFVVAIMLALAPMAAAHPGHGDHEHHHPVAINETQAETKAQKLVVAKVEQGKLPKEWLKRKAAKSYKKSFGHGPEWVVEFHDPEPEDEKKKVLYVYMTESGKTLGINFTGQ